MGDATLGEYRKTLEERRDTGKDYFFTKKETDKYPGRAAAQLFRLLDGTKNAFAADATAVGKPELELWAWRDDSLEKPEKMIDFMVGKENANAMFTKRIKGEAWEEYTGGYPFLPGYFGAFSYDALFVALWAFSGAKNFKDALSRCVNMLGDADSTGAITSMLAGAFFGYNKSFVQKESGLREFIPELHKADKGGEIALRTVLPHELSLRENTDK